MFWFQRRQDEFANKPDFAQLSAFIEASPISIARIDKSANIMECNQAFVRLTHGTVTPDSSIQLISLMDEEGQKQFLKVLESLEEGQGSPEPLQFEMKLNDGESITALCYFSLFRVAENQPPLIIVFLIDHTEQKNLEMRYAHSQKMQAVGQLAGGIAHDFNNLLTAMIGFCDLLLMRHPAGDSSFADIMQIKQNANRAANLIRQLLAFSRRQTLQPKTLDLTDTLAELSNLIRRLIGENIELNLIHGRDLWFVKADQGQLEQVIINLAVNARDAMKKGGLLTIRSANVTIDENNPLDADLIPPSQEDNITPGEYIQIEIIDNGHGIPKTLLEKIFEPFFSTKEVGHGTGLGLATVYGIIKQTGGYIYVRSAENVGTTFVLYIPRHIPPAEAVKETAEIWEKNTPHDLTGGGTVLLVEDETPVRIFAARALRNKGYEVLEADCGENALEVFTEHDGKVDVIISDVVMPGINGPTMIETLEKQYADKMKNIEVIFISGYAEDAFIDTYGADREFNFLPKPFTLKQLASKLKEVMQSKTAA